MSKLVPLSKRGKFDAAAEFQDIDGATARTRKPKVAVASTNGSDEPHMESEGSNSLVRLIMTAVVFILGFGGAAVTKLMKTQSNGETTAEVTKKEDTKLESLSTVKQLIPLGVERTKVSHARIEDSEFGKELAVDYHLATEATSMSKCTLVIRTQSGQTVSIHLNNSFFNGQKGTLKIPLPAETPEFGKCEISVEEGSYYSAKQSVPGRRVSNLLHIQL